MTSQSRPTCSRPHPPSAQRPTCAQGHPLLASMASVAATKHFTSAGHAEVGRKGHACLLCVSLLLLLSHGGGGGFLRLGHRSSKLQQVTGGRTTQALEKPARLLHDLNKGCQDLRIPQGKSHGVSCVLVSRAATVASFAVVTKPRSQAF